MRTVAVSHRWLYPALLAFSFSWPTWVLLSRFSVADRLFEQVLLAVVVTLAFLALPIQQRVLWFFLSLTFPAAAVWGSFALEFGSAAHAGVFTAVAHSNFSESMEWLQSHAFQATVIFFLLPLGGVMVFSAPRQPVFDKKNQRFAFVVVLGYLFLALIQYDYWYGKRTSWALLTAGDIESNWPIGPLSKVFGVLQGFWEKPELDFFYNEDREDPLPVKNLQIGPVAVIFVIGESHRVDTLTPALLDDATKKFSGQSAVDRLLWLKDVCAGSNLTFYSVPMLVTGVGSAENYAKARVRPSGLAYFKQAGFSTAWISNQDKDIFFERGWDYSDFALRTSMRKPDELLLPKLKQFLRSSTRTAAVVHLQGSHFDYENRYPANASLVSTHGLSGLDLERAHFKNSEAYAASVLAQIIELVNRESRPTVLLFTSDHGENLRDDERNLWRHSGSKIVSAFEIKVPTMIAWNSAYELANSDALANLKNNSGKRLVHANLFPLWLRMGGVVSEAAPAEESPDSAVFLPRAQRTFLNTSDLHALSCDGLR